MQIYFEKDTEEEIEFDYEEIAQRVITTGLEYFSCPYEPSVNIYLYTEEQIRSINREYRQIDSVTDVLSFPNITFEKEADFSILEKEEDTFDFFDPDTGELLLGDIIICQKRMEEQALAYGHSLLREYAFLLTHSLLHLLGFDHMEEEERIRMEAKQKEILEKLQITRD